MRVKLRDAFGGRSALSKRAGNQDWTQVFTIEREFEIASAVAAEPEALDGGGGIAARNSEQTAVTEIHERSTATGIRTFRDHFSPQMTAMESL
jgi:hypothetical protein